MKKGRKSEDRIKGREREIKMKEGEKREMGMETENQNIVLD